MNEKKTCRDQSLMRRAEERLKAMGIRDLTFLGQGAEGTVFRCDKWTYKVFHPTEKRTTWERQLRLTPFQREEIAEAEHLYKIEEMTTEGERDGEWMVVRYAYEPSEPCHTYTLSEASDFLAEVWHHKMCVPDCKPANFRVVYGRIKLIDFDTQPYSDNLFLNMCARMFLYSTQHGKLQEVELRKLTRSAINNFGLPELAGLSHFVNDLFGKIILRESRRFVEHHNARLPREMGPNAFTVKMTENLEDIFFRMLKEGRRMTSTEPMRLVANASGGMEAESLLVSFAPLRPLQDKVSLLIKSCAQDMETIEENVKHIVRQFCSPNPFHEIVVSVDSRERDFTREFNTRGDVRGICEILDRLVSKNVIDRYVIFPPSAAADINLRWFNLVSDATHTGSGSPLASQLWAFEQCKGDYILQMDSDVMVARQDMEHSYLTDMLRALKENPTVLSVGMNICNLASKEWFGFHGGGFVPEVRCCLLDLRRMAAQCPLPNAIGSDGSPTLSWYRSMERRQKETGACSIRGGDSRTFFIHPQNYRKTSPDTWMTILDRTEQLAIPPLQLGAFDCAGSLRDWSIPKRGEKMVVLCMAENPRPDRLLRMWASLMSQSFQDFGIILMDNRSTNGAQHLMDALVRPVAHRVTLVKCRHKNRQAQNIHKAINQFMADPQTIVVLLNGEDALIGQDALSNILRRYETGGADLTVGRTHRLSSLRPHYGMEADFAHPRREGSFVSQPLISFRKYLFDSIPLPHLRDKHSSIFETDRWLATNAELAIVTAMVEMSDSPCQMDHICYLWDDTREETTDNADRERVLRGSPLQRSDVMIGYKTFATNQQMVEMDITYHCNLMCDGCNRFCSQMPTKERISLERVKEFIRESKAVGKRWDLINILGGEPTLHPDFLAMVRLLKEEYVEAFSPATTIQIVSNGVAAESRRLCEMVKELYGVRIDYNSYKSSNKMDYFTPINDAPMDSPEFADANFRKGCWVTSYCGMGFNARGYYACAVCASVDRVLGTDHAIKSLADVTPDKLRAQLDTFCRWCGNFKHYAENQGNFVFRHEKAPFENIISESWRRVFGM